MLRGLVVLLLVANLAFFAWSRGWLDGVVGARATGDREPDRLARQVRPDAVTLVPPGSRRVDGGAVPSCFEAGPFPPHEVAAAEAGLQRALPAVPWSNVRTDRAGTWLVYMGSFSDRAALLRKEDELRRGRLAFEEVVVPGEGEHGLALARFDDRGAAERALAQMAQRGLRTARVVQLTSPASWHVLRIERPEPAVAAQLARQQVETLGKAFAPCPRAEVGR